MTTVDCIKVFDGGSLVWCCNWTKNEKFTDIFQEYVDKCLIEKSDIAVFDGYAPATKDVTRKSRSGKMSETVEIEDIICAIPIEMFF